MADPIVVRAFLGGSVSGPGLLAQRRAALIVCLIAVAATIGLLPFADRTGTLVPGFGLINQTALITAYALSAWVLFAQFRRDRSLALLLVASGTLYTAAIVLLQLLSIPGVVFAMPVFGAGSETTIWLWTFWHVGPPTCALAYALARREGHGVLIEPTAVKSTAVLAAGVALAIAGAMAVIATFALPWLPRQVIGDSYWDMVVSGVGPAVQLLTMLAFVVVWRATRRQQTVLDLWITVSLFLLILDNFLTLVGGARASIGWYFGRVEATVSAFVILWAYLHEIDSLRARAEASASEAARVGEALRQAQKMEAIGRLTGGIAHDFNNLLMVMSSGFSMIRRRPDDRARVIKMADAGLEASQRGARLTRQLLTFASRQNLNPETLNLNASLLDFEPLARRALGETTEFELRLHPALHPARIDPGEFEAAVLNLIVNARDAVPPHHGRVVISTRNEVREAAAFEPTGMEALPEGAYVVVAIADNGSGMDEATRAQAFDPFFTTKEFGKGSGLGLSQVYGFARGAGGMVAISSMPRRGTTVEIWLPNAKSEAKAATRTARSTDLLRHAEAGEIILAVEDEPAVLAAVVEHLAEIGYGVIAARDAGEALERLRGEDRVDILFSDVVMPGGMNGVELANEARRLRPDLRVLLTSGYTGEALAGDHDVPSDVVVLVKPYRLEELAERLRVA